MNRLAAERSPYLRQHADNPVDWYPWGDEAKQRAVEEDKPLFVSIGYASCHWCHVMAHESFEDADVGRALREACVSVKVDREERPDVDSVYMAAVQATTGSGGWPMSVFCTPDGRPFFCGTYFPPTDRHGMPSFRRVIAAVAAAWRDRRQQVEAQADALAAALARQASLPDVAVSPAGPTNDAASGWRGPQFERVLGRLVSELRSRFDPAWGGWGAAPKFPRPTFVELCMRHALLTGDESSLAMATATLDAMAAGGIYDHLAGGFARYSTDARWLVPHFEKMLTDQALLARAYLHAWQVTGNEAYRQVLGETLEYVADELADPAGAWCSSMDADAAGVEGGHATWTTSEVLAALDAAGLADACSAVCEWYGVTDEGNWEGRSVLARPLGAPLERPDVIERARQAMLAARRRRPQPARDDKVLTEWSAMLTAVMAEAAAACGSERWAARAERAGEALFAHNRRDDGRWLRASGSPVPAFAADHAWVVESCTRLAELTGRAMWLERAAGVADALLDLFWDDRAGGLFTAGRDAEQLIVRSKELVDSAVPSAASAGATALLRLGALTGGGRWTAAGEALVEGALAVALEQPLAVADMVPALGLAERGAEILVAGDRPDLLAAVRAQWLPSAVLAWGEPSAAPLWEGRAPGLAYVCHKAVCHRPVRDVSALEEQLEPLRA